MELSSSSSLGSSPSMPVVEVVDRQNLTREEQLQIWLLEKKNKNKNKNKKNVRSSGIIGSTGGKTSSISSSSRFLTPPPPPTTTTTSNENTPPLSKTVSVRNRNKSTTYHKSSLSSSASSSSSLCLSYHDDPDRDENMCNNNNNNNKTRNKSNSGRTHQGKVKCTTATTTAAAAAATTTTTRSPDVVVNHLMKATIASSMKSRVPTDRKSMPSLPVSQPAGCSCKDSNDKGNSGRRGCGGKCSSSVRGEVRRPRTEPRKAMSRPPLPVVHHHNHHRNNNSSSSSSKIGKNRKIVVTDRRPRAGLVDRPHEWTGPSRMMINHNTANPDRFATGGGGGGGGGENDNRTYRRVTDMTLEIDDSSSKQDEIEAPLSPMTCSVQSFTPPQQPPQSLDEDTTLQSKSSYGNEDDDEENQDQLQQQQQHELSMDRAISTPSPLNFPPIVALEDNLTPQDDPTSTVEKNNGSDSNVLMTSTTPFVETPVECVDWRDNLSPDSPDSSAKSQRSYTKSVKRRPDARLLRLPTPPPILNIDIDVAGHGHEENNNLDNQHEEKDENENEKDEFQPEILYEEDEDNQNGDNGVDLVPSFDFEHDDEDGILLDDDDDDDVDGDDDCIELQCIPSNISSRKDRRRRRRESIHHTVDEDNGRNGGIEVGGQPFSPPTVQDTIVDSSDTAVVTLYPNEQNIEDEQEQHQPPLELNEVPSHNTMVTLPVVEEETTEGSDPEIPIIKNNDVVLQQQIDSLLLERKNLQDRLFRLTKDYETRVTPFRDTFDEMRKLRVENKRLKEENRSMNETLTSTISKLQSQMTEAMGAALKKKLQLESELADTRRRLAEYESSSQEKSE